ncbi:MAG TPA: hypothetical protein VE954_20195 [Oligoflexus sp.]|uniref:hypothetical protein n=1 Tax=Oligoflexus sp. TaxID=1971216 RepID=UPI002D38F563|nr:hypothetical protein [Oligoflexus sp.]HYX35424.1 hypothetical protein [Oligoflexus sp.]
MKMTLEKDYEEAARILERLSFQKNFPLAAKDIHPSWLWTLESWKSEREYYVKKEQELRQKVQQRYGLGNEEMEKYLEALAVHEEQNLLVSRWNVKDFPLKSFFPRITSAA